MASQFEHSKVPKRHLRKITIYVERLEKDYWKKYTKCTWHVDNFMQLKDTVVYTNKIKKFNCDLKLKKKRSSATVTINTIPRACPSNIPCYVLYDQSSLSANTSDRFHACEISADTYEVTFPRSAIDSQQNYRLVNDGTLSLQFEFYEREREYLHSSRYKRDYWRPVNSDVGSIIRNPIMTDFTIMPGGGPVIKCHKALLAARSIFFRNYFNESCNNGNEISVSASFDILYTVVRNLYDLQYRPNVVELRDIIQLSWELDIPSWQTVCIEFMSYLTNDSFEDVKEEGSKIGLTLMMEKFNTLLKNAG